MSLRRFAWAAVIVRCLVEDDCLVTVVLSAVGHLLL